MSKPTNTYIAMFFNKKTDAKEPKTIFATSTMAAFKIAQAHCKEFPHMSLMFVMNANDSRMKKYG